MELIPFIILGVVSGSVYGLAGTGLVLTYRTTGIFNFAQGALGAVSAYVFYFLRTGHHWPWPVAFFVSVAVLGPAMGIALELFGRRLVLHRTAIQVVGTVGIILMVQAGAFIWYGSGYELFPGYLPHKAHHIGSVSVGTDQIIILVLSLVLAGVLYAVLRLTRLGIAMRAVVDDPSLLALEGISPVQTRRAAWVIGSTFAALAGVLLAPSLTLNATFLILLVVQAFGAAAIGRFRSLPLTVAGGMIIGIAAALSTKYSANISWLTGVPSSIPFLAVVLSLLLTPRRFRTERPVIQPLLLPRSWRAPWKPRLVAAAVAAVGLIVLPTVAGSYQFAITSWLIYALLLLSLGFVVKTSGQVSLCHLGFAAVGAAAFGHLLHWGIPWGVALILAGLFAVPVGAMVAFSAVRLSGIYLAIATYGFGVLIEQLFYPTSLMFRWGRAVDLPIPLPGIHMLQSPRGYYYLTLSIVAVVVLLVTVLDASRYGRLLSALSESGLAVEIQGTSMNVLKVSIFCLSALIAGIAGALLGAQYGIVDGTEFSSFGSLTIFVILMLIVCGLPWYSFIAAASVTILPTVIKVGNISNYLGVLFGLGALALCYQIERAPGVPEKVKNTFNRFGRPRPTVEETPGEAPVSRRTGSGLEIADLTVRFGGVRAVDGFSLTAPLGRITALIGPNGAGKTTTLNACSGLIRGHSGRICLHGDDVTSQPADRRALKGMGRTFQRVELWNSLTVRENISIGAEAHAVGRSVVRQMFSPRGEADAIRARVDRSIEMAGVGAISEREVGNLSSGQRRLVELARCLVGSYDILLLDEPSSGLDAAETQAFGRILRRVVEEEGVGIVLVEHDMSLVLQVSDYVYVLNFGREIFSGTPGEMTESKAVQEAYLGSSATSPGSVLRAGGAA